MKSTIYRRFGAFAAFSLLLTFSGGPLLADGYGLIPDVGCPMAHCDPQMSDLAQLAVPDGNVSVIWHHNVLPGELAGTNGLGCASDGQRAFCSYSGASDNLVAYDYDGFLWSAGSTLNDRAYTSAPLVDSDGNVYAADNERLVKYTGTGTLLFNAPLPSGGTPTSPVVMQSGGIVFGTAGGPVYVFDSNGVLLESYFMTTGPGDPGQFDTTNTVATSGDRIYVSARHLTGGEVDDDELAWLIALDFDGAAPMGSRLSEAWHFEFAGNAGASPLVIGETVYFDGGRLEPGGPEQPVIFAVRDYGTFGEEVWRKEVANRIPASFARDPRGGFWFHQFGRAVIRLDENTGAMLQNINVDKLIRKRGTHRPVVMTIGGTATNPVMLTGATAFNGRSTYVVSMDLVTGALNWKLNIVPYNLVFTQFPILQNGANTRVIFPSGASGARAVGVD